MKLQYKLLNAVAAVLTVSAAFLFTGCSIYNRPDESAAADVAALLKERSRCRRLEEIDALNRSLAARQELLCRKITGGAFEADLLVELAELLESPYAPQQDKVLAGVLRQYAAEKAPEIRLKNEQQAQTDALRQQHAAELLTQAVHAEDDYQKKVELLHESLKMYPGRSALALAVVYCEKPQPNLPMAVNSALCAAGDESIKAQAQELAAELDALENSSLVLLMQLIWQERLRGGGDLEIARIPADMLLGLLRGGGREAALSELKKLQQHDPDGFYTSGISFLLREYFVDDAILEDLLSNIPQNKALQLPALLTAAAIAGEGKSSRFQQRSALALLEYVANMQMEKAPEDLRKKLAAAIPQAAHLPWQSNELRRKVEMRFALLWNVAADLWINALMGQKELEQAEKFLQDHPRIKLTEPYKSMERNFVKRFARNILQSDGKMTEK